MFVKKGGEANWCADALAEKIAEDVKKTGGRLKPWKC